MWHNYWMLGADCGHNCGILFQGDRCITTWASILHPMWPGFSPHQHASCLTFSHTQKTQLQPTMENSTWLITSLERQLYIPSYMWNRKRVLLDTSSTYCRPQPLTTLVLNRLSGHHWLTLHLVPAVHLPMAWLKRELKSKTHTWGKEGPSILSRKSWKQYFHEGVFLVVWTISKGFISF